MQEPICSRVLALPLSSNATLSERDPLSDNVALGDRERTRTRQEPIKIFVKLLKSGFLSLGLYFARFVIQLLASPEIDLGKYQGAREFSR